jgi:hypothetical protein
MGKIFYASNSIDIATPNGIFEKCLGAGVIDHVTNVTKTLSFPQRGIGAGWAKFFYASYPLDIATHDRVFEKGIGPGVIDHATNVTETLPFPQRGNWGGNGQNSFTHRTL